MTLMLVPMASQDQKCDVGPLVDCLDMGNAVVPLMMLSASHDADTGTNGIS